jgi:hypothetical protein
MILKKRPGIAACLRLRKKGRQTIEKIRAIFVVPEYLPAFDSPDDEVMQNTGSIQSGVSSQ